MQSSAHRNLQKHCDAVLKDYGISKMQWLIIGSVLDAGRSGVRITELAEKLGTTLPYLTTTVNMLEYKNMLARREYQTDSRSKLIIVAPSFKRQCSEIERVLRDTLRRSIYAQIEPNDLRTYMKVMYKLSKMH